MLSTCQAAWGVGDYAINESARRVAVSGSHDGPFTNETENLSYRRLARIKSLEP
jgi:hypothetical protein